MVAIGVRVHLLKDGGHVSKDGGVQKSCKSKRGTLESCYIQKSKARLKWEYLEISEEKWYLWFAGWGELHMRFGANVWNQDQHFELSRALNPSSIPSITFSISRVKSAALWEETFWLKSLINFVCTAGKICIEHVTIFSVNIFLKVLLTWNFHQMSVTIQ